MRARKISETIEFKQPGEGDSYQKMHVGQHREFQHGDRYMDKNDNILTYNKNIEEFWYYREEGDGGSTVLYLKPDWLRQNPDIFTKIKNQYEST